MRRLSGVPGRLAQVVVAAVVAATLVPCIAQAAGKPGGGGGGTVAPPCTAPSQACNDLYVVAHQDDDLLFANPALRRSLTNPKHNIRTIYVTAGDNAEGSTTDRWSNREAGVKAAYADMVGTKNQWTESTPAAGMHQFTLTKAPRISLIFMRLYEGARANELRDLWDSAIDHITDIFDSQSFTRQGLIDALRAQYVRFAPNRINTLDSSRIGWDQHPDHFASALFALAANGGYTADHTLTMYRDYNTKWAPRNVWGADWVRKEHTFFDVYGPLDTAADFIASQRHGGESQDYPRWVARMYSFASVAPGTRAIGGPAGRCLASDGLQVGAQVVLADCGASPQRWTITASGRVTTTGGLCIGGADSVRLIACSTLNGKNDLLMTGGQLRIGEADCAGTAGRTDAGAPVVPEFCFTATQGWWPQADAATTRTTAADFSDNTLPSADTGDSYGLADVNGDGAADACARRTDGVYCALNNGSGSFAAATRWTTSFSDADGWQAGEYGRTIRFADVSGDGRADACGRSSAGVVCAVSDATTRTFVNAHQWTAAFSDATGYNDASYYKSFALVDVDGDGLADACSRAPDGVRCAINTATGNLGADRLVTDEFSDAAGWAPAGLSDTVTFGDINGDGRADVCGRTSVVICATAVWAPAGDPDYPLPFARLLNRSTAAFSTAAWSTAARYRSLRIADVNGDGYGDVCGRDDAGVQCAIARPMTDDPVQLKDYLYFLDPFRFIVRDFSGAEWNDETHGASLRLADLNKDGRADACWRSSTSLICATT